MEEYYKVYDFTNENVACLDYLYDFKAECTHYVLSDYNLSYQLFKEKVPFCLAW